MLRSRLVPIVRLLLTPARPPSSPDYNRFSFPCDRPDATCKLAAEVNGSRGCDGRQAAAARGARCPGHGAGGGVAECTTGQRRYPEGATAVHRRTDAPAPPSTGTSSPRITTATGTCPAW